VQAGVVSTKETSNSSLAGFKIEEQKLFVWEELLNDNKYFPHIGIGVAAIFLLASLLLQKKPKSQKIKATMPRFSSSLEVQSTDPLEKESNNPKNRKERRQQKKHNRRKNMRLTHHSKEEGVYEENQ